MFIDKFFFFFISFTAIFPYNLEITDTHILPKWIYTSGISALAIGIYGTYLYVCEKDKKINEHSLFAITWLLSFSQAIYANIQFIGLLTSRFSYRVVGSFDNPAGLAACLCVGIPCCIYFYRRNSGNIIKWISIVVALVISVALVLSESRAGILAGVLLPTAWFIFRMVKKFWGKILLVILGGIILTGMYFVKKDSANGRILMLYCGWEMVKERPLFGHGSNAIPAYYMDYQATWLEQHPDSQLAPLADNVKHVFNEFLSVVICYGFLGLGVLFLFVVFLVHCYLKCPSEEGMCALLILSSIGLLACFSYPLTYPFTWIVLTSSIWVLLHRAYPIKIVLPKLSRYVLATILSITSACMLYQVHSRLRAELKWGEVANLLLINNNPKVLSVYEELMNVLGNEPYFLYNYAAELYYAEEYDRALQVAQRCRIYWADYDLELLLGELQMKARMYDEAEKHYRKASAMCPNRFMPLHKLFRMALKQQDYDLARFYAEVILSKPIKVDSAEVRFIINECYNYYHHNKL